MSTFVGARHSYGATLGIDPTGGSTYALVAEVVDMDGPSIKTTVTDVTNLASPNKTKEKITGFTDPGQIKCKLNMTMLNYAAMLGFVGINGMSISITYPLAGLEVTGATLVGKGQLAELGQTIPEDDKITCDATFEATGHWTFTPAV